MDIYKNNKKYNSIQISETKVLIKNSFSDWVFENSFLIFKSFYGFYFLVYATEQKSIIFYNLIHFQVISEIKEAHKEYITNFSHCFSKNLNMDIIMSTSKSDNNIKLWNVSNNNCILNLSKVNANGILNSACFLNYKNNNYIITSNRNWVDPEPLKVYDLINEKYSTIKNSNNNTFCVDSYYDNKNDITYIIAGNEGNVISYNYNENELYNTYCEQFENNVFHQSFKIYEDKNDLIIKLIESSDGTSGIIRIWDFHNAELLGKFETYNNALRCIEIFDEKYAFVGSGDKSIKLIDLENLKVINNLIGHINNVCSLKIIVHPIFGKCIISQGHNNETIRVWILLK